MHLRFSTCSNMEVKCYEMSTAAFAPLASIYFRNWRCWQLRCDRGGFCSDAWRKVKFQRFLWERKNDHWSQFDARLCFPMRHNGATLLLRISNEEQWNKTEIGQMSMMVTLGVIVTAVFRLALRACQCLENLRCSAWALWGSAMMKIAASWSRWTHAEDRDNVRIGNGTASQFLLPVYASVMHSRCARKPDRTRLVRPSMSCRRYGSYELSMAPRQGDVPRNCTKCNGYDSYDSYDSYGVIWTIACHDALVLRKAPSAKLRSLELVCGRLHIEQTTRCFSFLCKHSCRF